LYSVSDGIEDSRHYYVMMHPSVHERYQSEKSHRIFGKLVYKKAVYEVDIVCLHMQYISSDLVDKQYKISTKNWFSWLL
jgi:hypothetical protein